MRPLVQQPVVSHPTRAGRASCMRQRTLHTVTAPAHTYSTRPAPWNRRQVATPECQPHHQAPRKHSLRGWKHDGGWGYNDHPGLTTHATSRAGPDVAHPSAEGNFIQRRYVASSPPLEGCPQGGVVREFEIIPLLPIVTASNKKHCGHSPADIFNIDRPPSQWQGESMPPAHNHPNAHRTLWGRGGCRAKHDGGGVQ